VIAWGVPRETSSPPPPRPPPLCFLAVEDSLVFPPLSSALFIPALLSRSLPIFLPPPLSASPPPYYTVFSTFRFDRFIWDISYLGISHKFRISLLPFGRSVLVPGRDNLFAYPVGKTILPPVVRHRHHHGAVYLPWFVVIKRSHPLLGREVLTCCFSPSFITDYFFSSGAPSPVIENRGTLPKMFLVPGFDFSLSFVWPNHVLAARSPLFAQTANVRCLETCCTSFSLPLPSPIVCPSCGLICHAFPQTCGKPNLLIALLRF